MKLRYKIYLVVGILATTYLLGRCQRKTNGPNKAVASVLPGNDKEQIIVDPKHHTLSVLTTSGLKLVTLPDKPSKIDIHKDGSVKLTAPQFGFEVEPFIGLSQSDYFRANIGMDFIYWKKLDLGIGLGVTPHIDQAVGFIKASYNIWDNLQMGVIFDNRKNLGVMMSVRI